MSSTTVINFLKKHYVEGVLHTHVSLVEPRGKFQLSRDNREQFMDIYSDLIENDDNNEVIIGIGESPQSYLPVLADIDIAVEESTIDLSERKDEDRNHLYTQENVIDVIDIYQSVLRKIVHNCTDEHLLCVLLEKNMYKKNIKGVEYLKNGFHLHFPNCFLSKNDQENQLIPRVKKLFTEMEMFKELGIDNSSNLVDPNCCNVRWLLYGSRKDPSNEPYKITKIFDSEGKELSLQDAFNNYTIYDKKENPIKIKGNVKKYLPRILSIIPYGRDVNELKPGLNLPFKENNKEEDREENKVKIHKNIKLTVTENLKIASKLLPLISSDSADDFMEWMRVGWILYCIGDGCYEAYEMWNEFSSRSDKYDESKCMHEWERMVNKGYTIGSLKYMAKRDNPKLYEEFMNEQTQEYIKTSLDGSHNDIAKLLYSEYGTEFVCASVANKTWYQYKNHRWEEIEEGIFLRKLISDVLVDKYIKEGQKLFSKIGAADKAEESLYQLRLKQVQKIITNLKNSTFKNHIMKEACEVFYNQHFKEKLDTNPYLICFRNGVYDLKMNKFREGRPDDYLSKQMPINYVYFNKNDSKVSEVESFLEKVFPDRSVRTYFLDTTSDVFVGGNHQKVGIFWTGDGDNAKSVTQTIIEKMLGEYAIKISTTLLTSKKSNIGSASPELARCGGVRWVVFEEPDKDEEIHGGTFKNITGNDSFWARDLFEKGKSTREITPLFKVVFICNKLSSFKGGSTDKAVWNRVKVLPFESTFVRGSDKNPAPESFEEQLLQKRFPMDPFFADKIPELLEPFAWYLLEHRKNMKVRIEPEKVTIATTMYRKQNDIYRQFIEEKIIQDKDVRVSLDEIRTFFNAWYKDSFDKISVPSKNELKEYFTKLWGEPESGIKWYGYRIRNQRDDVADGSAVIMEPEDFADFEHDSDEEK
jgi:P4 family phage/plasmid primase-like protien